MNSSKTFTVINNLANSTNSDCLIIKAPNVVLNINNHSMTGNGAGIGIHILSSATDAFIEARAASNVPITSFATGVQDDANGMTLDSAAVDGNSDIGVMFNGTSNSSVDDSNVNGNGKGVLIMNGGKNEGHHSSV